MMTPGSAVAPRAVLFACLLLAACDAVPNSGGPTSNPAEKGPAAATPDAPARPLPAATAPAARPAAQPATSRPATQPATQPATRPADPPVPGYLQLISPVETTRAMQVRARYAGARISLDTENVARLRLLRAKLEPAPPRSLAVLIDGQGIQWLASAPVLELERSSSGRWSVVNGAGR